jgi:GNAT superfamily N-acetyltransferase
MKNLIEGKFYEYENKRLGCMNLVVTREPIQIGDEKSWDVNLTIAQNLNDKDRLFLYKKLRLAVSHYLHLTNMNSANVERLDAIIKGHGLGTEMMNAVAMEAKNSGAKYLHLAATDTARGFYRKLGFKSANNLFFNSDILNPKLCSVKFNLDPRKSDWVTEIANA